MVRLPSVYFGGLLNVAFVVNQLIALVFLSFKDKEVRRYQLVIAVVVFLGPCAIVVA
jgi:hypothetical protein